MRFKYLAISLLGLLWTAPVLAEVTTFSPTKKVEATLVLEGSMLTVVVKSDAHSESRTIAFQAENELHVQIDDFNFDGAKDFAVWQIDDGMGTYTIHRIFVYQPEAAFFKELNPDCGDDFVNLRVEREKRALLSTYWEMNEPKLCSTNFSPD
ncbi:hypothetical protein PMI27_002807 [Pseudomonas sp. GM41(2012)]|uniref:XAC2610-related protein n=1 Tax=Pseudomonas sp. (strain GM41(2012)) TaxID=1144708 RepID=UPI0002705399|nr:hypothetical protein [Pseudomonas sp. GM41(2012)]EUB73064.1 hypothetical protein PMI27_002807 [Pseudomonas sp. GM41(2012)]